MTISPAEDSELHRLAREGEARRSAAAAEEAAAERLAAIRGRREVRRLGASNLLDTLADYPRAGAVPLFRWTAAALVAATLVLLVGERVAGSWLFRAGFVALFAVPLLYFGARRWLALRALRDERAWLHDLPFPVRGYFALLCTSPCESRTVRIRLRGADPGEELVRGLAGRAGGAVRVSRVGAGWEIESGTIHSLETSDIEPTNAPLLAWMRGVIEETLLPLHATYPITSARFLE